MKHFMSAGHLGFKFLVPAVVHKVTPFLDDRLRQSCKEFFFFDCAVQTSYTASQTYCFHFYPYIQYLIKQP